MDVSTTEVVADIPEAVKSTQDAPWSVLRCSLISAIGRLREYPLWVLGSTRTWSGGPMCEYLQLDDVLYIGFSVFLSNKSNNIVTLHPQMCLLDLYHLQQKRALIPCPICKWPFPFENRISKQFSGQRVKSRDNSCHFFSSKSSRSGPQKALIFCINWNESALQNTILADFSLFYRAAPVDEHWNHFRVTTAHN